MVNVNVNAMLFLSRYYVDKFVKKNKELEDKGINKRSAIINFSSIAAFGSTNRFSLYSSTKSFNRVFSLSLTTEYESQGVDVMVVTPMSVKSGMNSGIYLGTITSQDHAKSVID